MTTGKKGFRDFHPVSQSNNIPLKDNSLLFEDVVDTIQHLVSLFFKSTENSIITMFKIMTIIVFRIALDQSTLVFSMMKETFQFEN